MSETGTTGSPQSETEPPSTSILGTGSPLGVRRESQLGPSNCSLKRKEERKKLTFRHHFLECQFVTDPSWNFRGLLSTMPPGCIIIKTFVPFIIEQRSRLRGLTRTRDINGPNIP